jgi:CopG family nickel-responsive transcriptional regulator
MALTRVSLTLPEELLKELDSYLGRTGYPSRSEAIRDALQAFLSEQRELRGMKGEGVGVLVLLYDHETRGLVDQLTDLQHECRELITSTQHVHLDAKTCLEILVLRGKGGKIAEVVEKLGSLRGVKLARLVKI